MNTTSDEMTKRYLMIELSCDQTQCKPCTYPNCQRYVRLKAKSKKFQPTVKTVASKELEVNVAKESELERSAGVSYPHHVTRYILTELSCSDAKCSPCTYPNCQRFVRSKKITGKAKSPIVSVTELKDEKDTRSMISS